MLRDPNLIPLSHQHQHALAMCVLTRRSLGEDGSPANVARLAGRAVDRYDLEIANHFEIEEQILFPAIENALGPLPLIAELIAEHRQTEALVSQLRSTPSAPLLEQLCALFDSHIRREERDLFQMAQSRLPQPVLSEVGAAIERKAVRICL